MQFLLSFACFVRGVPFTDLTEIQFNRENISIVYNRFTALCPAEHGSVA